MNKWVNMLVLLRAGIVTIEEGRIKYEMSDVKEEAWGVGLN